MKIYVVLGATGEYSDRSEWMVAAYISEADAKKHVLKAQEYADAWKVASQELEFYEREQKQKTANPLDDNFDMDYTGTRYWYAYIELHDHFTNPEVVQ